jgi:hypothetical protein
VGVPLQLGPFTDLTFKFKGVPILCECKRIQTPSALNKNLKKAERRLRDTLKTPAHAGSTLGVIALDVSRIVHLDAGGAERYPQTPYGSFFLPSNMVTVQNKVQFEGAVKQRLDSFAEQHLQIFSRAFVPRVAGFLL